MTRIKRTNSDDPDFQKLTQALDVELCRIYNTQQADYEEFNRIADLATVVLAYENDIPVGCGCFKKYDDTTIEIKRMYVEADVRGKGIASRIVGELETWALELKNDSAILETGKKQPEAIAMYHKLGYFPIERYGQYSDLDNSVRMRKQL
ncbi:GNAT family N-acetyltransferase [Dyadobacter pollutisoli]|uniref:GNAT family N-acetyltransferase n=1 Tax=Dyadobacter pollutisoli TaxID=2910158 RepID=A0A9E8N6W4_9BACT|nr:GNAT family N-acetyltransferase [Dyadobacter pollutisoli]WAC10463.1 GNAT family N-acetyltransferase [Dyadobacter pollutisoli]